MKLKRIVIFLIIILLIFIIYILNIDKKVYYVNITDSNNKYNLVSFSYSSKKDNNLNLNKLINSDKIEKLKRDAAIEQKEEAHKAKMELDKEIKEKKR